MNWEDHIDDYLDGKLSEEFQAQMKQELAVNDALRKALDLHRDARVLLHVAGYEAQRNRIKALDQGSKRFISHTVLRIAAAIALLVALPTLWYVLQPTDERTIAAYFEPYPDRITTMGETNDRSLTEAMTLYNTGKYEEAVAALMQAAHTPGQEALVQHYIGVSYLAMDACEQALPFLSKAGASEPALQEAATWYYILALVDCGSLPEAKAELKQYLSDSARRYNRSKAEALLLELE